MVLYRNEPIAGFFVSPTFYCKKSFHSYVRIRFILIVLILLLTNFVVWSWALEKHPEQEEANYGCPSNPYSCNSYDDVGNL